MPLEIIRNDITKMKVDAIVNPTDSRFSGGGGVDRAVHLAAGRGLSEECKALGGCEAGQAKLTKGYNLAAKYVIHTVGPIWQGGNGGEEEILTDCYMNSLSLVKEMKLESIAFPIISSGTFAYPKDRALGTANTAIGNFLGENDMDIFLVVYDQETFEISEKLLSSVKEYIDENYVDENLFMRRSYYDMERVNVNEIRVDYQRSLDDVVDQLDDTFSQTLMRLIDEKGMTDVQAYKRANIDRKLFSKIRSRVDYSPSKQTAVAFAIALNLNLDETRDLLLRAGFALSSSSRFDVIIKYFISNGMYNIFDINEVLFHFGQDTLGGGRS